MSAIHSFTVLPVLPDPIKELKFVAENLYWSWNPEFVDLFRRIDHNLYNACGHNPVKLLVSVSQERLEELACDQGFVSELSRISEKLKNYLEAPAWFDRINKDKPKPSIAYFSAEFGLHEAMPIYSGGLGILAGDHLKSASDLGLPLVGVGLLYQKGYFRQYLNVDGWQQEVYAENEFYNMPIKPVLNRDGNAVVIKVNYPEEEVYARIWSASVGRIRLYLLDTNIAVNSDKARAITSTLYGGDREMRIRQEIMLGIGGLRALVEMAIVPTVCHMNEGHAAFMALERIRLLRKEKNITFEQAVEATKLGNVFTIHTPVKAGLDEFSIELMDKYFSDYANELGIDREKFLSLGRSNPEDQNEIFAMPILAMKLSSSHNGVSKLHGEVSRKMWTNLWPGIPVNEIPIGSVTNGIHTSTWLSEEMNHLFESYISPDWVEKMLDEKQWNNIDNIPSEEFWQSHQRAKGQLIAFARNRLKAQLARRGTYHSELNWAEEVLDPQALTIGFARRFASYKRGNLLLNDPKRLAKILMDPDRGVQIIFAGKAHPRDNEGKEIIRRIVHFANRHNVRRRILFLEDYDINVARYMVQGVDVWLNNPRRPLEASGTSGMKAAVNGALNVSTLDGWWCEGYRPDGGWTIGAGENYDDCSYQDMVESQALYNILENEVIPLFYSRSAHNIPRAWIHRVKNSIKWIAPRFNTHRMVTDYTLNCYSPSHKKWKVLNENELEKAKAFSLWKEKIYSHWPELAIEDVQVDVNTIDQPMSKDNSLIKVGAELNVKAMVFLGHNINPSDVSVEIYHGPVDAWGDIQDGEAVIMDMVQDGEEECKYRYETKMCCRRAGRWGAALRILPKHDLLTNSYELGLILWESTTSKKQPILSS